MELQNIEESLYQLAKRTKVRAPRRSGGLSITRLVSSIGFATAAICATVAVMAAGNRSSVSSSDQQSVTSSQQQSSPLADAVL